MLVYVPVLQVYYIPPKVYLEIYVIPGKFNVSSHSKNLMLGYFVIMER